MIRLAEKQVLAVMLGEYFDAPTWGQAMEFVQRHFDDGGGGRYAIFRWPIFNGSSTFVRWLIVRVQ